MFLSFCVGINMRWKFFGWWGRGWFRVRWGKRELTVDTRKREVFLIISFRIQGRTWTENERVGGFTCKKWINLFSHNCPKKKSLMEIWQAHQLTSKFEKRPLTTNQPALKPKYQPTHEENWPVRPCGICNISCSFEVLPCSLYLLFICKLIVNYVQIFYVNAVTTWDTM